MKDYFYLFNVYYMKLTGVQIHLFKTRFYSWRPAVLHFYMLHQILSLVVACVLSVMFCGWSRSVLREVCIFAPVSCRARHALA